MSAGLKLQGQFKFDLYDKSGNLLKSSDYVNNFITQSGLMYPMHFAFADCFRFLSIGDSDVQNSITLESETVGLTSPINGLIYIGSRTDFDDKNSSKYAPQPSCGYRFPNENVVELYRMWSLPSNDPDDVFQSPGIFKEFAVSPGRPYVEARDESNNIKYLCSCNETKNDLAGEDCSAIADYYNFVHTLDSNRLKICDATASFARILYSLEYPIESRVNITYKLTISVETGLRKQQMNNASSQNGNFGGHWNLWQGVTQLGLKLINNGSIPENNIYSAKDKFRLQHFGYDLSFNDNYTFTKEYGESFIPPYGIPLEPSTHNIGGSQDINSTNIVYYFSEDNTQFLISENGGALSSQKTGELAPWNFYNSKRIYSSGNLAYNGDYTYKYINAITGSGKDLNDTEYWSNLNYLNVVNIFNTGIKKFKNNNDLIIYTEGQTYWRSRPEEYNIRKDQITVPDTGDILFQKASSVRFYLNSSKSTPTKNFNPPANGVRTVSLSKTFIFDQFSLPNNLYVKSLVGAYKDLNTQVIVAKNYPRDYENYIPFLDSLSENTSLIFLPNVVTGIGDYGIYNNTGASISGSDNVNYFYLSNNTLIYPILTDILTWSADCPNNVDGC